MIAKLKIEDFLLQGNQGIILDIRTPGEFEKARIVDSTNFPLFSDEERAEIGTIYKQVGKKEALLLGLERVGPRMSSFLEMAEKFHDKQPLALYCWRGGKRSESMAWLLDFGGFDVLQLVGGYKAYRRHVLNFLSNVRANLIVLGGRTGTGKTQILHELRTRGEQIIDLEDLANHKGSAFGSLGEHNQPSNEHFENLLFHELNSLDLSRRVWVENESQSIGVNYIINDFWRLMKTSPLVNIQVESEMRLKNILEVYAQYEKEDLKSCFSKIKKKIGGQNVKEAIGALDKGDYQKAVEIALWYYDKTYDHCLKKNKSSIVENLECGTKSAREISDILIEIADDKF
jgi:tRNA 2-selenouridine synthase